jgi:hypothetical protein
MYNQRIGSNHRYVPGRYDIVFVEFWWANKSICKVRVKVVFTLEQAMEAQRGIEVLYSFFDLDTRCYWVVNATPGCFTLGKETWYSLYRRPVGP